MNYTNLLTAEEKATLCGIITGKEFRELFKRNEQEFSKIRKGFRAKSLTNAMALSVAVANIDKPFIYTWVNMMVDHWLTEIKENINRFEGEGTASETALASTMLDSFFANNVDLYLKLTETVLNDEKHAALLAEMKRIKLERAKSAEISEQIKTIEAEKGQLLEQLKSAQEDLAAQKAEYEIALQQSQKEKIAVEASLAEAEKQIMTLQAIPTVIHNDDTELLAQYDDTNSSVLPSINSDEIVSLCGVVSGYNDQKLVVRFADLNHDGQYYIFRRNDEIAPYFLNRDKVAYKDIPYAIGFYGIWTWSAIPNEKDPTKDFAVSKFNMDIDPIEVITVSEVSNLDELVGFLKRGIKCTTHGNKVMFSAYISKGRYIGILCSKRELTETTETVMFNDDLIAAPVYEFTSADIIRLDNGLSFYKDAFAGIPCKIYQLKRPIDIVKNIVLSSVSWGAYRDRGFVKSEYRSFRDFLEAVPVSDITESIANKCNCSHVAAEELLRVFLDEVWKYIDGDSIDDKVIVSALSANESLREQTKAAVRAEWEAENEELLTKANRELDLLDGKIKSAEARLAEVWESYDKIKGDEARIMGIIAEKEKLAADVEIAVSEKIRHAQENVADFIANMSFVDGRQGCNGTKDPLSTNLPQAIQYHIMDTDDSTDDWECYKSWADVIDSAAFELEEAGVAETHSRGLAAVLCAAYIEKQPILLVGPNAADIVRAFSATVSGGKYGMLNCDGVYNSSYIEKLGSNGETVVVVNNLFSNGWVSRIPEILSRKDIFYFVTHPYAEDIQVEPKSLYGFMLPLFTEFFVDKNASGNYHGGYFADNFKAYSAPNSQKQMLKAISLMPLSLFVKNKISGLVSTMQDICPLTTEDDKFLFAIIPIAYATLELDKLMESVSDPQNGLAISSNLKHELKYLLGDI